MVDISTSFRVETHNVEDVLCYRDKNFYPSSGWNYLMRRNMQEVIPGLFLGPYSCALEQCHNNLLEQGITHIVCVRDISEAHFIRPQLDQNFTYLTLDIADSKMESIIALFSAVNKFINEAFKKKSKVLVHGNTGISRSATLVVAYVMETYNLSYVQALKLVKEKRGCINPNESFTAQLYEYEVLYKTKKFFELCGQSSKMRETVKRKHDEMDQPHSKVDPVQLESSDSNETTNTFKKFANVSRVSTKRKI